MNIRKLLPQMLLAVVASGGLTVFLDFIFYGVPVFDRPDMNEVVRVQVEDTAEGDNVEITAPEDIELACKLINFLNSDPFTSVNACQDPVIKITYELEDGQQLTAWANYDTGWWNGRMHALKEQGTFVNIARGICFPGHLDNPVKQYN